MQLTPALLATHNSPATNLAAPALGALTAVLRYVFVSVQTGSELGPPHGPCGDGSGEAAREPKPYMYHSATVCLYIVIRS